MGENSKSINENKWVQQNRIAVAAIKAVQPAVATAKKCDSSRVAAIIRFSNIVHIESFISICSLRFLFRSLALAYTFLVILF